MPRAFAVPLCVLCLMVGQVRAADDVVAVSLTERTALHPGWIPLVAPVSLLVPDPHAASTRLLAETATATFIN